MIHDEITNEISQLIKLVDGFLRYLNDTGIALKERYEILRRGHVTTRILTFGRKYGLEPKEVSDTGDLQKTIDEYVAQVTEVREKLARLLGHLEE